MVATRSLLETDHGYVLTEISMSDVVVPQTCSSFAGDELISTYERAGTQAPRKCDVGPQSVCNTNIIVRQVKVVLQL